MKVRIYKRWIELGTILVVLAFWVFCGVLFLVEHPLIVFSGFIATVGGIRVLLGCAEEVDEEGNFVNSSK